jgi:hypothetical protein
MKLIAENPHQPLTKWGLPKDNKNFKRLAKLSKMFLF